MNALIPHHDSMSGADVGVLKFRDYDASLVVREEVRQELLLSIS